MTSETTTVVSKTEKPNSYEFGKAGNRFKLFFETPADLDKQIKELKDLNLIEPEIPL